MEKEICKQPKTGKVAVIFLQEVTFDGFVHSRIAENSSVGMFNNYMM